MMKNEMPMSQSRNIVVFWIDEAPRVDFSERLSEAGMQVFYADNYTDGVQWLSNPGNRAVCDAVILDVNCKIRHSDEQESTDSFRDYAYRMMNRCEGEDKHIPWFVFTTGSGYDESLLNAIPMREWTRRQYYLKDSDQQALINDIRELTKHSDNVAMREKYAGIFDLCEDSSVMVRLYDIIRKVENPKSMTDTTVFNAIRKLLAYAVVYGGKHGLFPDDIENVRAAQRRLDEIHELAPDIVPSYILTNFESLSDTVNNGSHSKYEDSDEGTLSVDADVLAGDAPYLTRTCIYQLLTVFYWLRHLPTKEGEIEALRKRIDMILNNPVEFYENRECYLQCDNGVWHYGRCAVREYERYPLSGQTLVRLKSVQPNRNFTAKKHYPFFARYEIVH